MTDEEVDTLLRINEAIPESDTVVHGDFHPKNVMIQNGELALKTMKHLNEYRTDGNLAPVPRMLEVGKE